MTGKASARAATALLLHGGGRSSARLVDRAAVSQQRQATGRTDSPSPLEYTARQPKVEPNLPRT